MSSMCSSLHKATMKQIILFNLHFQQFYSALSLRSVFLQRLCWFQCEGQIPSHLCINAGLNQLHPDDNISKLPRAKSREAEQKAQQKCVIITVYQNLGPIFTRLHILSYLAMMSLFSLNIAHARSEVKRDNVLNNNFKLNHLRNLHPAMGECLVKTGVSFTNCSNGCCLSFEKRESWAKKRLN